MFVYQRVDPVFQKNGAWSSVPAMFEQRGLAQWSQWLAGAVRSPRRFGRHRPWIPMTTGGLVKLHHMAALNGYKWIIWIQRIGDVYWFLITVVFFTIQQVPQMLQHAATNSRKMLRTGQNWTCTHLLQPSSCRQPPCALPQVSANWNHEYLLWHVSTLKILSQANCMCFFFLDNSPGKPWSSRLPLLGVLSSLCCILQIIFPQLSSVGLSTHPTIEYYRY